MFGEYFNGRYILDKKALINIVLSERSDGKTFDCKVRALEDYKAKKTISVYLRRYKTEITPTLYNTFFDEVLSIEKYNEYKNWQFRGSKKGIEVKLPESDKWDFIVYFIPLSISGKIKSTLNIQRIDTINFDEYVPLDGRYLPDEMALLLEFYKSVDRDRDITQMIILGNKITPFIPIFDFFNIKIELTKEKIKFYNDNTIAVQIYSCKEHKEFRKNSRFNTMIKNSEYEEYNDGGILFALNIKTMQKNGAEYICSFLTENGQGTIWGKQGCLIISLYQRKDGYILTDKYYNIDREFYTIDFGNFKNLLKQYYRSGNLYFESETAFHYFENILKKCY